MKCSAKKVNLVLVFILGFSVLPLISWAGEVSVAKEGKSFAEARLTKIWEREQKLFQALEKNPEGYSQAEADRLGAQISRDYEAFILGNESYIEGFVLFGKFLRKTGHIEEANDLFLRANKINPKVAVVKQQIGNYLAEKAEFGLAMHYYLSAIELDPEVSMYHYCLGELLYQYKEEFIDKEILSKSEVDSQMIKAFEDALRLEPKERVLQFRLAEAYYDLDAPDWEKTLGLWDELEASSDEELDKQVIALHQARVLFELGRIEDSREALSDVTALELKSSKEQIEEMLPKVE